MEEGDGPAGARPLYTPRTRVDAVREAEVRALHERGRGREALEVLMTTYGAAILGFATRIVRDRALAEDVRQQVFLEAYRGFGSFEGRSSLWGWLCGIAYHRSLDEVKRRRRHETRTTDVEGVLDVVERTPDAAMDADRLAERRALGLCLRKLPEAQRAQLLMRCSLGLSYAEIAAFTGEAHGTVQVRISRILPRLRKCLRDEGVRP